MEPEEPTATQGEHNHLPDPGVANESRALKSLESLASQAGASESLALSSRLTRVLLGLGILGAFGFSLLANLPLAGIDVPFGVGTLLSAGVLLLCGLRFRDGGADEKVSAGAVTLMLLHLASQKGILSAPGSADVASLLAARLSSTTFGFPLLGVLYAWALLAAGFLTARAVSQLALAEGLAGRATTWTANFIGALVGLFGLRGLIGYVTGSTSLFG